jgi:hypothetical protein
MPIQKLYRVQCSRAECRHYLGWSSTVVSDPALGMLFTDYQDAIDTALERGWTGRPIECPVHEEKRDEQAASQHHTTTV